MKISRKKVFEEIRIITKQNIDYISELDLHILNTFEGGN